MKTQNSSYQVAIVGLGLIGGSLALSIRDKSPNSNIIGIDNCPITCKRAVEIGMVDACVDSLENLPDNINLVVLATPVSSFNSLAMQCKKFLSPHITISDVGSTKKNLLNAFKQSYKVLPDQLVPAHPIAGAEQSGVDAAYKNLFYNKKLIIIPTEETSPNHYKKIHSLWQMLGCHIEDMNPEYHDMVFSKTSHLPHLLSFAMVHYLSSQSVKNDIFRFAASGFRDLTRMAASSPDMWSAIFSSNKENMLNTIDGLQETINTLKGYIEDDKTSDIHQFLTEARDARKLYADKL